eukprot:201583_1
MDQPELNHIERTSTTTIIYAQQTINDIGDSLEKNATVMSPFNSEITAITIFSSLFICAIFCCIFLYIKSKQIMSSQSSKQPQIISNQIPDNKPRSPSIMIHTYLQSQGITDITQHNASDLIEVIISSSDENENTDPNRKHIVHGSREDNIQKITVTKTECGGNMKHETVNNILKNIKDEKKDNKLMEVMLEDILNKKSVSEDSDDIYDKPENDNVFINDISVISPLKITVSQCEGNMKLNKYSKNENDINICDDEKNSNLLEATRYNLNCIAVIKNHMKMHNIASTAFSTGFVFWYWPYYKSINDNEIRKHQGWFGANNFGGFGVEELFVNKLYDSVKEEVLNSKLITVTQFNQQVIVKGNAYLFE